MEDIITKAKDFATSLKNTGRTEHARLIEDLIRLAAPEQGHAKPLGDDPSSMTGQGRARKPQDPDQWPGSLEQEEIESLIDTACGCKGKFDCQCISVFNETCSQAWYDHNTRSGPAL